MGIKTPIIVAAPELPNLERPNKPPPVPPARAKPCPIPTEAGSKSTIVPFPQRVKQLTALWGHYVDLAHHLGLRVVLKDNQLVLIEDHLGYVLDARATALKIRELMNECRSSWPDN